MDAYSLVHVPYIYPCCYNNYISCFFVVRRHHATIGQLILSYNNNETNQVGHIYEHVFNGYSIKMNDEYVIIKERYYYHCMIQFKYNISD